MILLKNILYVGWREPPSIGSDYLVRDSAFDRSDFREVTSTRTRACIPGNNPAVAIPVADERHVGIDQAGTDEIARFSPGHRLAINHGFDDPGIRPQVQRAVGTFAGGGGHFHHPVAFS
jgi:hypothetical protein